MPAEHAVRIHFPRDASAAEKQQLPKRCKKCQITAMKDAPPNLVLFLGPPNSGKTALIGRIMATRHTTTLQTIAPKMHQYTLRNGTTITICDTPGDMIRLFNVSSLVASAKVIVICLSRETQGAWDQFRKAVRDAKQGTLVILALLQFQGGFNMCVDGVTVVSVDRDLKPLITMISDEFRELEPVEQDEPKPRPNRRVELNHEHLIPTPKPRRRRRAWIAPVVVVVIVLLVLVAVLATKLAHVW